MRYYDTILKIRIDKETLSELKKIAKKEYSSVSEFIRALIYAELNRQRKASKGEKCYQLIKEILKRLEKLYEL